MATIDLEKRPDALPIEDEAEAKRWNASDRPCAPPPALTLGVRLESLMLATEEGGNSEA